MSADGGNGVATDADDLIRNKVATFLTSATQFPTASNRWTRSKADVSIGTKEYEVFLAPPSGASNVPYMNFHTRDARIFLFPSTGFSGTEPAYDQPGCPTTQPDDPAGGPVGPSWETSDRHECQWVNVMGAGPYLDHHIFAPNDGRYCYVAVQCATRKWRHFWFGSFNKYHANLTGGEFCFGLFWDQSLSTIDKPYNSAHCLPGESANNSVEAMQGGVFRCPSIRSVSSISWYNLTNKSTFTDEYSSVQPGTGFSQVNNATQTIGRGICTGRGASLGTLFFRMDQSPLSNLISFFPFILFGQVDFDGDIRYCAIGEVPDVFRINMKNFTPGALITVGSDDYRVFPVVNSDVINTLADQEYSGYEGYAYKVTP